MRTTSPENFPVIYHEIANTVGMQGSPWRVPADGPMPSERDASGAEISGLQRLLKLRGHFYSFKGACKRAKDDPKWSELYVAVAKVSCYIDMEGVAMTFRHQDTTWHARALAAGRAIVEDGAGTPAARVSPPMGADASLARVLSNLPNTNKEGIK